MITLKGWREWKRERRATLTGWMLSRKGIEKMDWKKFLKATLIRCVRTFAESALAYIGTGAILLGDVNWLAVLSAGGMGFVIAFLMALATGLPEVDK